MIIRSSTRSVTHNGSTAGRVYARTAGRRNRAALADLQEQIDMIGDDFSAEGSTVSVLVSTQYMENYGAHDWDGEGDVPQSWRAKGGMDYLVTGVPAHYGDQAADLVLNVLGDMFEHSSDYSREFVIGARVVGPDYLRDYVPLVEVAFPKY